MPTFKVIKNNTAIDTRRIPDGYMPPPPINLKEGDVIEAVYSDDKSVVFTTRELSLSKPKIAYKEDLIVKIKSSDLELTSNYPNLHYTLPNDYTPGQANTQPKESLKPTPSFEDENQKKQSIIPFLIIGGILILLILKK